MSGTHTTRSVNGGYFTAPNRWFDAGYARALKPSVTIVFMFIRRWADVNNGLPSQPIKTIATQCGLTEKVVREAIQTLESIGVMKRLNNENQHTQSVWEIYDLADHFESAPVETGDGRKAPPSQKTAPLKTTPHYQPEYINNESNDSSVSDSGESSTVAPTIPEAPTTKEKPVDLQIMEAFCDETGLAKFASFGRARKEAQQLAKADFTPDEVRQLVRWLKGQSWISGGISLGLCLNQADKFRTMNVPLTWPVSAPSPTNPVITNEEMAAPWMALRESMMAQHAEKKAREQRERAEYEQQYI